MCGIHFRKLLWMYCLGHGGINANDRAASLVGKPTVKNGLRLGRSEVLKNKRYCPRAQSQDIFTVWIALRREAWEAEVFDDIIERTRDGHPIVNKTNIGTISKATVGNI